MKRLRLALLLLACSSPVAAAEIHCDGNQANLKIVEEMTDVLFNKRDDSLAPRFYADTVVSHNVDSGVAGGVQNVPVTDMQKMWRNSKAAMPDRKLVNDLILCSGDIVTVRTTMSGTMTGSMYGLPATGKAFNISAIDIYRFKNGKVVERWGNNDQVTMLKQLGLLETVAKTLSAKPE